MIHNILLFISTSSQGNQLVYAYPNLMSSGEYKKKLENQIDAQLYIKLQEIIDETTKFCWIKKDNFHGFSFFTLRDLVCNIPVKSEKTVVTIDDIAFHIYSDSTINEYAVSATKDLESKNQRVAFLRFSLAIMTDKKCLVTPQMDDILIYFYKYLVIQEKLNGMLGKYIYNIQKRMAEFKDMLKSLIKEKKFQNSTELTDLISSKYNLFATKIKLFRIMEKIFYFIKNGEFGEIKFEEGFSLTFDTPINEPLSELNNNIYPYHVLLIKRKRCLEVMGNSCKGSLKEFIQRTDIQYNLEDLCLKYGFEFREIKMFSGFVLSLGLGVIVNKLTKYSSFKFPPGLDLEKFKAALLTPKIDFDKLVQCINERRSQQEIVEKTKIEFPAFLKMIPNLLIKKLLEEVKVFISVSKKDKQELMKILGGEDIKLVQLIKDDMKMIDMYEMAYKNNIDVKHLSKLVYKYPKQFNSLRFQQVNLCI